MRRGNQIVNLLREHQFLTADRLARLDGTKLRAAQRNLSLLFQEGKIKRLKYFPPDAEFTYTWVYHLLEDHSRRTLDHELDLTDYHIRLSELCGEQAWELIWQQKHMTGKFYPDAYFSIKGLHFFLEVERQPYGNVRRGKPGIVRKAESYYEYYDSKECHDRWGFTQFRVIFQLREIRPDDFLARLPDHRMYWVGTPGSFVYRTPKDASISFLSI
jgi:hypothetical protein